MRRPSGASARSRLTEPVWGGAFCAAIFAVFVWLFLDGLAPRDSIRYAFHGLDLAGLTGPEDARWTIADHWRLRWPMTLSIAASHRLFGPSETAAAIACAAWVAGLVAVTFVMGRRVLGPGAGTMAAAFTAGSAFCAAQAMEVRIHGYETAFGAAALWIAAEGLSRGDARRLLAAGVLAGGAWLCRETAVVLPAALGVASLVRFGPSPARWRGLLATSAGFLTVLGTELAAYWAVTGDPAFRLRLSANHEAITAGADPTGLLIGGTSATDAVSSAGAALASPLSQDPLGQLLSTPNVTPFLLGAVGLAVLALVFRPRTRDVRAGQTAPTSASAPASSPAAARWAGWLFGGTAAASWLVSSYVLRLEEPLYAPMVPYAAGVLAGWAVWRLWSRFGVVLGGVLTAGWLMASAAAADLRDFDEWGEARWLAKGWKAGRLTETVAADPITAGRVASLLHLEGRDTSWIRRPDGLCEGRLVVVGNPVGRSGGGLTPADDWRLVDTVDARHPSPARAVLRNVPVVGDLGPIAGIVAPNRPLQFFRAGPSAGPCEADAGT